MHLRYIVICAVLLSVATVIYINIDTEAEVDSQLTRAGILDIKEKNEPVIYATQIVLPISTRESIQIGAKKLTELNKTSGYIEIEPECESFIKVGKKKTCFAQYSEKEKSDVDYLTDKSLEYNKRKNIIPLLQNDISLPVVIIKSDPLESEQIFEGSYTFPDLN